MNVPPWPINGYDEIIKTTSKLVVCSAPIRGFTCLPPEKGALKV